MQRADAQRMVAVSPRGRLFSSHGSLRKEEVSLARKSGRLPQRRATPQSSPFHIPMESENRRAFLMGRVE